MQDLYQHDIEHVLKQLLLRRLTVSISKRVQKTGKLILYKIINHNIELTLGEPRKPDSFIQCVLPYPFGFKHNTTSKTVTMQYDSAKIFSPHQLATLPQQYKPSKILNGSFIISYE